jgi:hypothetical protein
MRGGPVASRAWIIGLAMAAATGPGLVAHGQDEGPALLPPIEAQPGSAAGEADQPPALPELQAPVPGPEEDEEPSASSPPRDAPSVPAPRPNVPRVEPQLLPPLDAPKELGTVPPRPFPGPMGPTGRPRPEATSRTTPGEAGDAAAAKPARASREPAGKAVVPATTKDLDTQRKLHRQIVQAAGPRLRSLSVVVKDKVIRIDARAKFFWQRRNVQRSIEDLPAVPGHRVTIQVR